MGWHFDLSWYRPEIRFALSPEGPHQGLTFGTESNRPRPPLLEVTVFWFSEHPSVIVAFTPTKMNWTDLLVRLFSAQQLLLVWKDPKRCQGQVRSGQNVDVFIYLSFHFLLSALFLFAYLFYCLFPLPSVLFPLPCFLCSNLLWATMADLLEVKPSLEQPQLQQEGSAQMGLGSSFLFVVGLRGDQVLSSSCPKLVQLPKSPRLPPSPPGFS